MIFTACLGFRDWYPDHLDRCLASLRPLFNEIVVIDLGSRDQAAFEASVKYSTSYVRHDHAQWSRGIALNYASRFVDSKTTHFVFTDADMIFPHEWVRCAAESVKDDRTVWLTDSRDLGARPLRPFDLAALALLSVPHDRVGEGAAMIVPVTWFREVRGFDEFYQIWGSEDNDLTARARQAGLNVAWLPDVFVAHQYHRRDWPTAAQFAQVRNNREYLKRITFGDDVHIVRNHERWHGDPAMKGGECMSNGEGDQVDPTKEPEEKEPGEEGVDVEKKSPSEEKAPETP